MVETYIPGSRISKLSLCLSLNVSDLDSFTWYRGGMGQYSSWHRHRLRLPSHISTVDEEVVPLADRSLSNVQLNVLL